MRRIRLSSVGGCAPRSVPFVCARGEERVTRCIWDRELSGRERRRDDKKSRTSGRSPSRTVVSVTRALAREHDRALEKLEGPSAGNLFSFQVREDPRAARARATRNFSYVFLHRYNNLPPFPIGFRSTLERGHERQSRRSPVWPLGGFICREIGSTVTVRIGSFPTR